MNNNCWIPEPEKHGKADDDMYHMSWERNGKNLSCYFNCYGSTACYCSINLRTEEFKRLRVASFDEAWKWFCNDEITDLPHSCGQSGKLITSLSL